MNYDRQFLIDSIALLQKKRVAHMGAHQYAHHGAMRDHFPMSGALGWQRYERDCPGYYILKCEKDLIKRVVQELPDLLELGTPFIDLGTGTLEAVSSKSIPLIQALHSEIYVPIDSSLKFCSEAGGLVQKSMPSTKVQPSLENFFSDAVEPAIDMPSLGYLGGITIANIEAPVSTELPTAVLIKVLQSLGRIVGDGWLLLSTDANQSEAENKTMYGENGLFEINTFDRMAHELPIAGLDPTAITYVPVWIPESSQLAHTGVATKDMEITVKSAEFTGVINLAEGDSFHLKNSFKYTNEFFAACAERAGFSIMNVFRHEEKPLQLFLLKAPQLLQAVGQPSIAENIYEVA